jgi:isopropylmalate/homocitrate/citramalate synthase
MDHLPRRVRIVEVGPRDGLQNEANPLSTEERVRFVELLAESGLTEIESGAFVSPARVPQMADSEEVFARIRRREGVRYSALVPNARGLERALGCGVRAIALFTAASETFNLNNIGMSIAESVAGFRALMPRAREHQLHVRAYVSTAFVCPFEGAIDPDRVTALVWELREMGADEISIGDTIGHANPLMVGRLTEALVDVVDLGCIAYHFHDTLGLALANTLAALQYGVAAFDSSAGGAGGCPFAPGAAGNVATEDLLTLLHGMGIETGVDVERVAASSRFLQERFGRPLPARWLRDRGVKG